MLKRGSATDPFWKESICNNLQNVINCLSLDSDFCRIS